MPSAQAAAATHIHTHAHTIIEHLLSLIFICIIQSAPKDSFFSESLQRFGCNGFESVLFFVFFLYFWDQLITTRKSHIRTGELFCFCFSFSFVQYLIVIVNCKKLMKQFWYFRRKDESPPPTCTETQAILNLIFTFPFNHIELNMLNRSFSGVLFLHEPSIWCWKRRCQITNLLEVHY